MRKITIYMINHACLSTLPITSMSKLIYGIIKQFVIDEIFEKDIRRRLKIRNKSTFETVQKYNRINFGPVLENITFIYAKSHDYSVSVGQIGKLECDFILRNNEMRYSYVQVAYTIALSKETEDREYKPLESIKDNYPKYVATADSLLQQCNGIEHINLVDFMRNGKDF